MTKRITLLLLLVLGVGLAFSVPTAWASEHAGDSSGQWRAEDAGRIDVKVRQAGFNKSASVVLYDQDGKAISEIQPVGGHVSFDRLRVGDYHVMAYSDELGESIAQEVPVFARRTTTLEVKLDRPVSQDGLALISKYKSCSSVATGEGGQLKVWTNYDRPVIYYQCGRIVGKVQTYCSGCGGGAWRYTTNCKKTSPIIVTIPCPRSGKKTK